MVAPGGNDRRFFVSKEQEVSPTKTATVAPACGLESCENRERRAAWRREHPEVFFYER
jgi:hypothetical protein